jgi:hypothetical protein
MDSSPLRHEGMLSSPESSPTKRAAGPSILHQNDKHRDCDDDCSAGAAHWSSTDDEADVSTEISITHESNIKAKRARLGSVLLEPEPYDTAFGHYLHDPSMDDEGEGGFADDEGDGAVLENTARGPSLLQPDQEAGSSDEPTGGQPSKESKSKRDRHKRPVDSTGYRAA